MDLDPLNAGTGTKSALRLRLLWMLCAVVCMSLAVPIAAEEDGAIGDKQFTAPCAVTTVGIDEQTQRYQKYVIT